MNIQIELIARAFHDAEEHARSWDHEPEILKDEFRHYARAALELLAQAEAQDTRAPEMFDLCHAA